MRLIGLCLLALPALAQVKFGVVSPAIRGPEPVRPRATHQRNLSRGWGAWGGGWWAAPPVIVSAPAPEPERPVLASSSLYQAEKARPVMREYGALPTPAAASLTAKALVAFEDGRVEPVLAYWREGELVGYVTMADEVRRVTMTTVDVARSEKLNRQQGVRFDLGGPVGPPR